MIHLLLPLLVLAQVDPIKIESKKITPEVRKQVDRLNEARVEAYRKACASVGAKLPKDHRINLRLLDGADPDPTKFTRHNGFSAETSSVSDTVVEIRFYTEYFVNGLLRFPEETLRHEMVHAVMRIDLGRERYQRLPKWLREGIAVHIAEQTESKLTYGFMQKEFAIEPEKLVDGLEDASHTLEDYPEDGIAILLFTAAAGSDGLAKLEEALRGGQEYRDAISTLVGKPFADFVAGAKELALSRVKAESEKLGGELVLYREILEKNEKSKAECERFLASFPKSPLRSAVLYYRAKSAGDDALKAYDEFIESAMGLYGYPGFIDDAKLRQARLLAKNRKVQESNGVYAGLVKWHIGSTIPITALYEWGLQIPKDRGVPLLKRALELDPKHRLAERAKKVVGD